jgi:hypothetical protein
MSQPKYRFNWQNPALRKTIYPFREKKLRDFYLTYYEIDILDRLNKVGDTDKDQDYQKMRDDLIDWMYVRLKGIEDQIQSGQALDPKRPESLKKEKEFLLNLESSVPRQTRLSKTVAGLDGRGIEVFQEANFTHYPNVIKNEYLQAAIEEVEGEHQEWNEEQERRRKYRDLVAAGTDLHAWWQKRLEEAQRIVEVSQADLAQLKRVKTLVAGETHLLNYENSVDRLVTDLAASGVIEAQVFNTGRFTQHDRYDYLVAVMEANSGVPAAAAPNDPQSVKLGELKGLLEQGKSLSFSPPLRAALQDLDAISRYLFKSERYARYPQASQYLATVIEHNDQERKAWEETLQYRREHRDKAARDTPLRAWWDRMASQAEQNLSMIASDLENLERLKTLLDQKSQSLAHQQWLTQAGQAMSATGAQLFSTSRYPRDYTYRYLNALMDGNTQDAGGARAASEIHASSIQMQKLSMLAQLMDNEQRFVSRPDVSSLGEQIRETVGALDPSGSWVFTSPRYTWADRREFVRSQVEAKPAAGDAKAVSLSKVKTLLIQQTLLIEQEARQRDQERRNSLQARIGAAIAQQDSGVKGVLKSNKTDEEKSAYLTQKIEAASKARKELEDSLERPLKNREAWKQKQGEEGQDYKFWKRKTDEIEAKLDPILAELDKLRLLQDLLRERERLASQGKPTPLDEQIARAIQVLGDVPTIEAQVFASPRFSRGDKLAYLDVQIKTRVGEQAAWKGELIGRQRNAKLAGEAKPLLDWWQEKASEAQRTLDQINNELEQLNRLKKSYAPDGAILEARNIAKEKSSLARLAILRKQIELGIDLLNEGDGPGEQDQGEEARHDRLLKLILEMFDQQPARFPKWLQYMVIHFSGIRYKTAHNSWYEAGDLLSILQREQPGLFSQGAQPAQSATAGENGGSIPIPANADALDRLRSIKDKIPAWAWKEIAHYSALRLDSEDDKWEQSTDDRRQYDDPEHKLWNGILNEWLDTTKMTLWRKKHEETLDAVMTSCVCNEIAENTQHARGVTAAGGLAGKITWYNNLAKRTADRPDNDPLKAFFLRPQGSGDIRPASSIFWLDWMPQCLYDDQAAKSSQVEVHNLLPDRVSLQGGVDSDGWRYTWENNRVVRRKLKYADPKNPKKFDKAKIDQIVATQRRTIENEVQLKSPALKGQQLTKAVDKAIRERINSMKVGEDKQYLRWTHEAVVVGVEDTLEGLQVLTFETAPDRTGLNRRNVGWLVGIDNNTRGQQVFVGYLPPLEAVPADVNPGSFLPGAYVTREHWADLQGRLNEMLRRDFILPAGGYPVKTYPKEAPPLEAGMSFGIETEEARKRDALRSLPGFWAEAAPKLDSKAPKKGLFNKEALDCYLIARKDMAKSAVEIKRGRPVRVASTNVETSRKKRHFLVTQCPDVPEAEGLYIREEDFIRIPENRAGIRVTAKQTVKFASFKVTDDGGKPDVQPTGISVGTGTEFLVSGVHTISDKDPGGFHPGTIKATGNKNYYLVIDCPEREAEGLLVRSWELEEGEVIPLHVEELLERRKRARESTPGGGASKAPTWAVVIPEEGEEARLFSVKQVKPGKGSELTRESLAAKVGRVLQVDPPVMVKEKLVSEIHACLEQPDLCGKYILKKDIIPVVLAAVSRDEILAAVKEVFKERAGEKPLLELSTTDGEGAAPRPNLSVSAPHHGFELKVELVAQEGRLVAFEASAGDGLPASATGETDTPLQALAGELEDAGLLQPKGMLLAVRLGKVPESSAAQLDLYWKKDL